MKQLRVAKTKPESMNRLGAAKIKPERLILTLLFLPFLAQMILFKIIPLFGWYLGFIKYHPGKDVFDCDFVGLENFAMIFKGWERTSSVLRNTFIMSGLSLLSLPLPMLFAILLSEIRSVKFQKLAQTLTTIPHFVSWIIVYAIAFGFFSTEGVLNTVLSNLGLLEKPINLLTNKDATYPFMWLLGIWKSIGWAAIIYFAAIAGVDREMYDAAMVDGADRWQRIRYITIPSIASTFLIQLLMNISQILSNGLQQYLVFYNSVVAEKMLVLDLYTYRLGMVQADYSYSTAFGITKTLVSLVLFFVANYFTKKIRGSSIV